MNTLKNCFIAFFATVMLALVAHADNTIKAGRAIAITISGVAVTEKSLIDGNYPVSDSGMVNLPHIGLIRAAGLKSDELSRSIEFTYKSRKIFTNPTVQVLISSIDTPEELVVHVGGNVVQPGPVKYVPGLTLYQAVQAARGATPFGSMYRVKVYRGNTMKEYDLTQGSAMSVVMQPNDTVEVPQKNWRGR